MRGHVKPITRERLEYMLEVAKQGPTELGYHYFRARRRRKNRADDEKWLSESDRLPLEQKFDFTEEHLERNSELLAAYESATGFSIGSLQWFIPWVPTPYLGGTYTILRFASHFKREHGVESRFCIYDVPDDMARKAARRIKEAFPELSDAEFSSAEPAGGGEKFSHLRECDAAIATFWTSAYPVLRFEKAKAKFFFVQDFEPYFYSAGSAFALAEESYRFGFPGIVNTPGLAEAYRSYGNRAVSFVPAVDRARYHPPADPRPDRPFRVFFYGRPSSPRNAFGLGLAALGELKERYGDAVDIVCAGESWNPGQFGFGDRISNLGRLRNLEEVADLYRTCHVGLVLMLTKHPSYQPFEFMASGVACVSNHNPDTAWFLRDGENCLLSRPTAGLIASTIGRLVDDPSLRHGITERALTEVQGICWEDEIERVWSAMTNPAEGFGDPSVTSKLAAAP